MNREHDVAILVVSYDGCEDLWKPFFHCFFKYWPDCPFPVFLGSNFKSYPDPRVHPVMIGPDVDYSANLLKMLGNIKQKWIILWIEDRFLSAPVDTNRLINLIRSAQTQQVDFLKLLANHPFAYLKDKSQEMGEIPKGERYRISITVALWNKNVLEQLLCPGETAWEIERRGSVRSNKLDAKFFSLSENIRNRPPLSDRHILIKGRLTRNTREFLKREGLENYLTGRALQTIWSDLYVKFYIIFFDIFNKLKSLY